ncbi:hypothetical protein CR205_02570 [Alteribacter lacisalsi]|uniref:Uncharacterized protein n=1 Tax=Alteribacter lacisalsi TaxID=2045244 RepID=A0A2W0HUZ5_9BACI|nr:hypothetical protein [Alteribacter lacisalsi]PYZ97498.1 hypothetical protein CR205_02570 [Alteribacter lacisalsi]
MESTNKLLEVLVEKTFEKYNLKEKAASLSEEQKAKLKSIITELKEKVETFTENAETTLTQRGEYTAQTIKDNTEKVQRLIEEKKQVLYKKKKK